MTRKTKLSCIVKVKSKVIKNTHFCNGVIITHSYSGVVKIKVNGVTVNKKVYSLSANDWNTAVCELDSIHNKYIEKFSG